jgi:hypothetical protein
MQQLRKAVVGLAFVLPVVLVAASGSCTRHHEGITIGVSLTIAAATLAAASTKVPQTVASDIHDIVASVHRHTAKYEALQRQVLQRTLEEIMNANATTSTSSNATGTPTNPTSSLSSIHRRKPIQRICAPEANGIVFPDDDFNIQLFRNDAAPMCSCYEKDNTDLVLFSLLNDNSANVTEYLNKLNKAFSRIVGVIEYECSNTCEHCFTSVKNSSSSSSTNSERDTFCGILQTNESSTYRGTEGNFSMEEYSTGRISAASWERLFSESSFSISTCIEYTKNEVGTLCYGSSFQNLSTTPTCYVQYNDTLCQSCTFPHNPIYDVNVTNNDCFIVDCSNIIPSASVINTCTGTGYNGIFRFMELIENGIPNTTTSVIVGSCDGPPTLTPIAAPVTVQQAAPSSLSVSAPSATSITSSGAMKVSAFLPYSLCTGVMVLILQVCC